MVYIDLLVIEDLIYNYVILLGVGLLLNRNTKFKKIFLASVIGIIPLIFLFIKINIIFRFFITFIFSILMLIISFGYRDILYLIKNIFYMYMISINLSGSINLININIFPMVDNTVLNIIVLIILAPVLTYIYVKSIIKVSDNYSNYYNVDIYFNESEFISVVGFLDTGNKLVDPYKRRPIILVNKNLIDVSDMLTLLVPYNTLNNHSLLECFIPYKIYIKNLGIRTNVVIGLMDNVCIDGVDCILNLGVLERI